MSLRRVLIIDDEPSVCTFLRVSLMAADYEVREEHTGRAGIQAAIDLRPEIIILDLGLPDLSGQEVLLKIREWSKVPILILTVRDSDEDKVAALDAGADDFLTKPFSVIELLARMRTALRHAEGFAPSPVFKQGNLEVDLAGHTVKVGAREVHLTSTEFDILKVFIKNVGKVVTHRSILKEVWGPNLVEHNQYLRVYVGHLRKKLQEAGLTDIILTEPGVGYRLNPNLQTT
jgi:two-component system KDP operon response regulator KdpE